MSKLFFFNKNRGQAASLFAIVLVTIYFVVAEGLFSPLVRLSHISRVGFSSAQSYYTAEASFEEVMMRLKKGGTVNDQEVLYLNGGSATTTTSGSLTEREISVEGNVGDHIRLLAGKLTLGSGASFNFGVQSDVGGLFMENNSTVKGNVYSNGIISGSNSNLVRGDAVSAGESGKIIGVHATGTAYGATIENSTIDRDAHYQNLINTTVGGTKYPGSQPPQTTPLPISDETVETWKEEALAGGVITEPCPYIISSSQTLGPVKIECDLEVRGNNYELTLGGEIWVAGDIFLRNGPTIRISSLLENQGVPIIADNPSNRLSSSRIILDNSSEFLGTGEPNSYILAISMNNSAEQGGSTKAIEVANSANGDLLVYAGHGEIVLKNNISLKQVSGYRLRLQNFAEVVYETGIASILFSSGPGGSWNILDWRESE